MSSADPAHKPTPGADENAREDQQALELIRSKIHRLYAEEPDAQEEAAEAEVIRPRSKHQQFMHELTESGKSLAEIQTAWHEYYVALPDEEKYEVWQEFYANHGRVAKPQRPKQLHKPSQVKEEAPKQADHHKYQPASARAAKAKTMGDIKGQIIKSVSDRARISRKRKHQLKSLAFGLGMGTLVLVIMLFGFFNERFIAPFITPSRTVSSTPIISDITASDAVSREPVIIIPKINIEIPVVYDEPSINEAAVQRALERGVLHYPTTPNPGEQGNATFFGHSSSNIFNNGKYKFAFVLLHRLEEGDTFMLHKNGTRYIYRVFEKRIVPPTEVSVLANRDRPTATLITCDPPGTDTNRLVVVGEQISPDPAHNVASEVSNDTVATPQTLPSEAPTLWSRFWGWLSS